MQRWEEAGRRRRRVVFALGALAHIELIAILWDARLKRERRDEEHVVETTILLSRAATPRVAPAAAPAPVRAPGRARGTRVTRPRPSAHEDASDDARAIHAAPLESRPIAQAASAAAPPASVASQPLNLTLSREQQRAIVAGGKPTLAQSLAAPPRPSAIARLGGGDAPYEEVPMTGGVTEVHVHGGCFRLVPTPRAQYDPFNHANERVTAPCM